MMLEKRSLLILITAVLISVMITSCIPSSSAESVDDMEIRTLCVFKFDLNSGDNPADITNTDAYIFEPGSSNEKQFLEYIRTGNGSMPSTDDRKNMTASSNSNNYFFSQDHYHNYIVIDGIQSWGHYYYGTLFLDNTSPNYLFTNGSTYTVTAYFDSSNYEAEFKYEGNSYTSETLTNGVEKTGTISIYGNYGVYIEANYSNPDNLWTTISYNIDGYVNPSSDGSGGIIIAAVFLIISALYIVLSYLMYKKPKWAN